MPMLLYLLVMMYAMDGPVEMMYAIDRPPGDDVLDVVLRRDLPADARMRPKRSSSDVGQQHVSHGVYLITAVPS